VAPQSTWPGARQCAIGAVETISPSNLKTTRAPDHDKLRSTSGRSRRGELGFNSQKRFALSKAIAIGARAGAALGLRPVRGGSGRLVRAHERHANWTAGARRFRRRLNVARNGIALNLRFPYRCLLPRRRRRFCFLDRARRENLGPPVGRGCRLRCREPARQRGTGPFRDPLDRRWRRLRDSRRCA
jgi:hypothetical protein